MQIIEIIWVKSLKFKRKPGHPVPLRGWSLRMWSFSAPETHQSPLGTLDRPAVREVLSELKAFPLSFGSP